MVANQLTSKPNAYSLLDADDCLLAVIDVQDAFLDKLLRQPRAQMLKNICWLIALIALSAHARSTLREAVYARLPIQSDGSIPMVARAWAVQGQV